MFSPDILEFWVHISEEDIRIYQICPNQNLGLEFIGSIFNTFSDNMGVVPKKQIMGGRALKIKVI